MLETSFLALFLAGLLGGGHCLGMCGGIVAALSLGQNRHAARWPLLLAYNTGRIGSYTVIGALAGGFGALIVQASTLQGIQTGLYVLANGILVLIGLYLAGVAHWVSRIEHLGRPLWLWIQPLARRALPVRNARQALLVGAVWGWVPCGLVYSASLSALASGNSGSGALLMLAFALGTLPNLLVMGGFAAELKGWLQRSAVRRLAGVMVCASGAWPLARLAASAWR